MLNGKGIKGQAFFDPTPEKAVANINGRTVPDKNPLIEIQLKPTL
jgi:hypothetical protein